MKISNLIIALILGLTIVVGCSKDDEETDYSTQYVGTYNCERTIDTTSWSDSKVVIEKVELNKVTASCYIGSDQLDIVLNGDASENGIVFPSQTIEGVTFSGKATVSNGYLDLDYESESENVNYLGVKQ